jgi:hypothetical protein
MSPRGGRLATRRLAAASLVLAFCAPSCGPVDPATLPQCGPPTEVTVAFEDNPNVSGAFNPNANPLVLELPVLRSSDAFGYSLRLTDNGPASSNLCQVAGGYGGPFAVDPPVAVQWVSSNPAVLDVQPGNARGPCPCTAATRSFGIRTLAPGEATLYANVRFADGRELRADLWCFSGACGGSGTRRIERIVVIER